MTVTSPAGVLRYPARSLVILTGLPGAGKTSLLQRLYALDGAESEPVARGRVVVIDSSQARRHWAIRWSSAPQRVRRAIVFATHVRRISRALAGGRSVLAHNRGCGRLVLAGYAWLARRRGAGFHLLLLDVPAETAMAGQHARGRVVSNSTFARYERDWQSLMVRVRSGDPRLAAGVRVLDRAGADGINSVHFD